MQNFHDLVGGFHHFRANYFLKEKEFFESLAHSQSPKTLVIACCDSRTDPAIVLGCKPGDLFVVRSVAAIVPPPEKAGEYDAVMAAVEYGVKHLDVDHIVVMGHSNCGGIAGLFNPQAVRKERFTSKWISLACPAVERINEENSQEDLTQRMRLSEEAAVLLSIENLLSYPWIEEAVQAQSLSLHALYYDMREGTLNVWNSEIEDFELATR
ncbi:MAG TPA: carbonic anhydrase [Candidatus Aphodousia faecavium]|uniref:carbonic anhydrase n=1 Tax=Parasutterella secunda TaxID=626947 RepID=A0ABS2GSV6_9BURK|nr:carbonic anhydrase [Parasutterella secunda]MBM6928935.1 carbonic anhydrase [Parasutterella secunda]HIT95525.1 carbonic anhydrase [Candidatus Aphodousia faecavium]